MSARKKIASETSRDVDGASSPGLAAVEFGTPAEREAGWAIVKEAMAGGWRSVGPYGPRADLYDRP